jgi:hypothetical protein
VAPEQELDTVIVNDPLALTFDGDVVPSTVTTYVPTVVKLAQVVIIDDEVNTI